MLVLCVFAHHTSNLVGNLYPAYASYKAVLSKDAKAHKQWLMFW